MSTQKSKFLVRTQKFCIFNNILTDRSVYAEKNDPYMALFLQLMNGLAFGALWMAGVAYAREITPADMGATGQGLLRGVYFGFSSAIGALLGGFRYEQVGSWGMYRWGAMVMFIGLLIFVLASNAAVKMMARQPVQSS